MVADASMEGYVFRLYSDDIPRQFHVGDRVFVWLKSNRSTGLATIVQTPDGLPRDSPFSGRYLARYDVDSSLTAHVRPERLYPVYTEQQQILVCYNTDDYRRLARSQVDCSDTVLELGCSYGMCTNILAEHACHVTGLDNSEEAVAEARRRYPRLHFEVADVLQQPAAVLELIRNRSYCSSCSSKDSNHSSSSSSSSNDNTHSTTSSSSSRDKLDNAVSGSTTTTTTSSSKDLSHSPSSSSSSRDDPHSNDLSEKNETCCSSGGRNAHIIDSSSSSNNNSTLHTQLNSTSPSAHPSTVVGAVQPRCCCCCSSCSSVSPCSVVFVDIGGNRQLEALLRLIPWVIEHVKPRLVVVKSEELAAAAGKELIRQQQQQGLQPEVQQQQQQQREQQADKAQEPAKLRQQVQQQQYGQQELQQEEQGDIAQYPVQPQQPRQQQQQYRQQADIAQEPAKLQQQQQGLGQHVHRRQQQCRLQQVRRQGQRQRQQQQELQEPGQQQQQELQQEQQELQHKEQADTAHYPVQPQQPGQQQQYGQQELQQEQQELQRLEQAYSAQRPIQPQQPMQQLEQTLNHEQHLEHQEQQQRQQLYTSADQQLCQQLEVLQCSSSNGGSRSEGSGKSAAVNSKAPTYGVVPNPKAWWDKLEIQQGLNPLLHSGEPEKWFLKARAQGFVKNPLRYPQRFTAEGVRICRPHNYDRCYKVATCEFDHVCCHHCGVAGHRAIDCRVA